MFVFCGIMGHLANRQRKLHRRHQQQPVHLGQLGAEGFFRSLFPSFFFSFRALIPCTPGSLSTALCESSTAVGRQPV